jgi:hypothetical protein
VASGPLGQLPDPSRPTTDAGDEASGGGASHNNSTTEVRPRPSALQFSGAPACVLGPWACGWRGAAAAWLSPLPGSKRSLDLVTLPGGLHSVACRGRPAAHPPVDAYACQLALTHIGTCTYFFAHLPTYTHTHTHTRVQTHNHTRKCTP